MIKYKGDLRSPVFLINSFTAVSFQQNVVTTPLYKGLCLYFIVKGVKFLRRFASVGVNKLVAFEIKRYAPECREGNKNVNNPA